MLANDIKSLEVSEVSLLNRGVAASVSFTAPNKHTHARILGRFFFNFYNDIEDRRKRVVCTDNTEKTETTRELRYFQQQWLPTRAPATGVLVRSVLSALGINKLRILKFDKATKLTNQNRCAACAVNQKSKFRKRKATGICSSIVHDPRLYLVWK